MTSTADDHDAIRRLILAGASDAEIAEAADARRADGVSTERFVIEAIEHRRDFDLHTARVRWVRRAAADDQLWALERYGLKWASYGSRGALPWNRQESTDPGERVTDEEAQAWLARAADQGSRPGALAAIEWFHHDPRAAEWMERAWGDGKPDDSVTPRDLQYAAYQIATALARFSHPKAGAWFERAVAGKPWSRSTGPQTTSWVDALVGCALWFHQANDLDACLDWSFRVMEEAANRGPTDRAYLASEYKTYRDEWTETSHEEDARVRMMDHLLREHDLDPEAQREVLLLRVAAQTPPSRGSIMMRTPLGDMASALGDPASRPIITQDALLTPETAPLMDADLGRPISAAFAWAFTRWIIERAVPTLFVAAGHNLHARAYTALTPANLRDAEVYDWRHSLAQAGVWPDCSPAEGHYTRPQGDRSDPNHFGLDRRRDEAVDATLRFAGLGAGFSVFRTEPPQLVEDWVWRDRTVGMMPEVDGVEEPEWRLLRDRTAWLGMLLAVEQQGKTDAWLQWWAVASTHLAAAVRDALARMDNAVARRTSDPDTLASAAELAQKTVGTELREAFLHFLKTSSHL